jgi:hypothetical protein
MATICSLPNEIIFLILTNLTKGYEFLIYSIRFGRTCKRFHALVDDPLLWSLRLSPTQIPTCFKRYVTPKEYYMHYIYATPYAAIEIGKTYYPLLTIHDKLLQFKFAPGHNYEVFYSEKLNMYVGLEYYMVKVTSIYILGRGQKIEFKKTSPNNTSPTQKILLFF